MEVFADTTAPRSAKQLQTGEVGGPPPVGGYRVDEQLDVRPENKEDEEEEKTLTCLTSIQNSSYNSLTHLLEVPATSRPPDVLPSGGTSGSHECVGKLLSSTAGSAPLLFAVPAYFRSGCGRQGATTPT